MCSQLSSSTIQDVLAMRARPAPRLQGHIRRGELEHPLALVSCNRRSLNVSNPLECKLSELLLYYVSGPEFISATQPGLNGLTPIEVTKLADETKDFVELRKRIEVRKDELVRISAAVQALEFDTPLGRTSVSDLSMAMCTI